MMRIAREAVTLKNRQGEILYGVVTRPITASGAEPDERQVVIFHQAGLQSKSGVGDYFRWLGDELTQRGYTVVRVDQAGTGDSTGELVEDVLLNTFFVKIQRGAFKDDSLDVMAWVQKTYKPRRLFLWGQCGGCISSTLACAEKPGGVTGLIMLVPPVLFLEEKEEIIREHDAMVARKGYLRKLLKPESYLRFLRGQSEYKLLYAAGLSYVRQARDQLRQRLDKLRRVAVPDHELFNWPFWTAFQEVMRHKIPVLFLMAELDNETPEFYRELKQKVLDHRPDYMRRCEIHCLKKADHSLMFDASRIESRDKMLQWMERVG